MDVEVPESEVEQFDGRLIVGEGAAGFDNLAQAPMQAFDGVGCVDHATDLRWVGEERNDFVPGPSPGSADRRIFFAPCCFELAEAQFGSFGCLSAVNGAQIRHDQLSVLPGDEIQRMARQMDNAGLDGGLKACQERVVLDGLGTQAIVR